jgi:hypothetical protein
MNWWKIEMDRSFFIEDAYRTDQIKRNNEGFTAEEAAKTEAITVFSDSDKKNRNVSEYKHFTDMSNFSSLKFLCIPGDLVPVIDIDSVKDKLEHLVIMHNGIYMSLDGKVNYKIFDQTFPNVKTLELPYPPKYCSNFDLNKYPALEWFTMDFGMDDRGMFLKLFKDSKTIKGFTFNSINNKNALKYLRHDLMGLSFWSITTKLLDYSFLDDFEQLEYLKIMASYSPIDCAIISRLPKLKELHIMTSKHIQNVDRLLDCPSLHTLSVKNLPSIEAALIKKLGDKFDEVQIESYNVL